ncbi:hypothetical protein NC652_016824 [Populus alba x Populus x berolinensis]|uniref:Uncharacterized protein n=1 Tax=Populus alba x Populus x berolinensis TaxID=444605 RepID=A0AAD6QNL6_9ROSI|nr:hypothetical protein NC652_016824 [Populus alba x Populus x berolinensis]KAJ6993731.1 hypothetical protein NC653_016767 [Populus alba x Populus x berolinensis]
MLDIKSRNFYLNYMSNGNGGMGAGNSWLHQFSCSYIAKTHTKNLHTQWCLWRKLVASYD